MALGKCWLWALSMGSDAPEEGIVGGAGFVLAGIDGLSRF